MSSELEVTSEHFQMWPKNTFPQKGENKLVKIELKKSNKRSKVKYTADCSSNWSAHRGKNSWEVEKARKLLKKITVLIRILHNKDSLIPLQQRSGGCPAYHLHGTVMRTQYTHGMVPERQYKA